MKKITTVILLAFTAISCGRFGNQEVVAEAPESTQRIVLISKQYCEIIYALGAQKNIVAVDVSSVYPPEVKKLPTVGYHRALSLEGLLAAKPTLIMHSGLKTLGPDHIVQQLQALNIPMKEFATKAEDIASTKTLMREMGDYFGKKNQADSLCKILDLQMNEALENAKNNTEKPKVLVIHYGRASNIYLVMTQKSTAAKLIGWAGGEMAVTDTTGMRHLSAELISQYNPDVILVTDYGYDKLGSEQGILDLPGVSTTKAAASGRIFRVEECDMVYLGPRSGAITVMLQKLIHQHGNE